MPVIAEDQAQLLKDPNARVDYYRDWRGWLSADEAIVESEWFVEPSGPTILLEEVVGTGKTVVWLEGGTAGVDYRVTNRIVTDSSPIQRRDDRSFTLVCAER